MCFGNSVPFNLSISPVVCLLRLVTFSLLLSSFSCFLFYVVASENAKYVTTKQTATDATMASAATDTYPPAALPEYDSNNAADSHNDDRIHAGEWEKENINDQTINILPNYKKLKKIQNSPQPATESTENNNNNLEGNLQNSPLPQQHTNTVDSDQRNSDNIGDTNVENSKVVNTNENIVIVGGGGDDNSASVNGDNKNRIHSSFEAKIDSVVDREGTVDAGGVGGGANDVGDTGNFVNQQVPDVLESERLNKNDGVDIVNEIADDNAER